MRRKLRSLSSDTRKYRGNIMTEILSSKNFVHYYIVKFRSKFEFFILNKNVIDLKTICVPSITFLLKTHTKMTA